MLKVDQPSLLLAGANDEWLQVIGVVGDARNDGLDRPTTPAVFLPYSFVLTMDEQLFVRATGNPDAVLRSVKERLRQVNPEMVITDNHTLQWQMETQVWGQERFIATLFSLFAALALALAATGLYSVVAYAVTQRTQEVGIRMALGVAAGLGLSVALNSVVTSWAKGSSRDPVTLLASAVLLLLVAVAACVVPAWRAATIDPMRALRTE